MNYNGHILYVASAAAVGAITALVCFCPGCKSSRDTAGEAEVVEGVCEITESSVLDAEVDASSDGGVAETEYLEKIGCSSDFLALASKPVDATLAGARSAKVVLDTADNNHLYFQNSVLYPIHHDFASTHLSGNGLPPVPILSNFNTTEYYSPERRFVLGSVTYYEQPKKWTLELAPYDTASAAMITVLYEAVKKAAFFGTALYFHPTSVAITAEAKNLSSDVPVVTTEEIYEKIDYQPLALYTGIGRLRFIKAAQLATEYLSYQDLVVIDQVPNDISVVQGIISQEFQTPLSHVNVLSQNRKTPNMGLRNAMTNKKLRALEGKLVELTVGISNWTIREVIQEEAEAYWEEKKPDPVVLRDKDLTETRLLDIREVITTLPGPLALAGELKDTIEKAIDAFGGKAAQYSVLAQTENVPVKEAFAVPVYYYEQFMNENGLYEQMDALLADDEFNLNPAVRDQKLREFREALLAGHVNKDFQNLLRAKINQGYQYSKVRFRTSTNSEDLAGFPCAGCYESQSGDPGDWEDILDAIRLTWSSIWLFRTFEERSYYGVDHESVSMALLVHNDFPDEEANGVAITSNPFDVTDPSYYVNVQWGGFVEVVHPIPGVTSDQFTLSWNTSGQPVTYISHSNLINVGDTVLNRAQINELGKALFAIHTQFVNAYGTAVTGSNWYAMDVEFKFDDDENPGEEPKLFIKQARPYPKPGR